MSVAAATRAEDQHAERWRLWQFANARSSQRTAARARIVFAIVLTGAAAWLGLQLLSSPAWR
jgi:hypothetical protein